MNDRRQPAFGMIELSQQMMHPIQTEIDPAWMQARQPRDQVVERRLSSGGRGIHACGAAGAASGAGMTDAASDTCGAGFGVLSSAGDLVNNRHSRANVGRSS